MKLYNPFKPHIVAYNDVFFVRKFNGLAWVYKESYTFRNEKQDWRYMDEYVPKYCTCSSLAQAKALRDAVWENPSKTPDTKKMKVIHG